MTTTATTAPTGKIALAHRWIRERILDGEFAPGSRLVLASIAEQLGTSVVPVREAIRLLEAEKLVVTRHNVGATVARLDETAYAEAMASLAILEGAATALAAPHLDAATLASAREVNRRMAASLDEFDPMGFSAMNRTFHTLLFEACPNRHLVDLITREWLRLDALRGSTFTFVPSRSRASVAEHDRLLDLIEAGAPASEIEAQLRAHRGATVEALHAQRHHRAAEPDPIARRKS